MCKYTFKYEALPLPLLSLPLENVPIHQLKEIRDMEMAFENVLTKKKDKLFPKIHNYLYFIITCIYTLNTTQNT